MARWRGRDNWRGEPWGGSNSTGRLSERREGSATVRLESARAVELRGHYRSAASHRAPAVELRPRPRSRSPVAPGSARADVAREGTRLCQECPWQKCADALSALVTDVASSDSEQKLTGEALVDALAWAAMVA